MNVNNIVMQKVIIDAQSFSKVESINLEECYEALQLLNCLLKWETCADFKCEIETYINCINSRIARINESNNVSIQIAV